MPMKALILVGGFGTRLRPLTLERPKPIVEFANRGMMVHQLEALVKVGVKEVILAVSYQPHLMSQYLADYEKQYNIKITYSRETEPLGTAGPLALARSLLLEGTSPNEPFFVLNSDVICDFPFAEVLAYHKAHGKEGTIMVTKVDEPSKYGVVVSKPTGEIERFVEKPKEFVGNRINAGIYIFNRTILDRIEVKPTSIEKEIFPAMVKSGDLFAMDLKGFWMDVGQPKDFLTGTTLYLNHVRHARPSELTPNGDKRFTGNVLMHPSATVAEGALVGPNVVLGPNTIVESGARLANTTVLESCFHMKELTKFTEGATIKAHAWIKNSIIGWHSSVGRWARLENTTVLGTDVHIDDEVYVNGGKILPHKTISDHIPEPQVIM